MQPWTMLWWFWTSQLLVMHSYYCSCVDNDTLASFISGLATTRHLLSVEYRSMSRSILQSADVLDRSAEQKRVALLHRYVRRKYSVRQQMELPPIHIPTQIFSYSLMISYYYNTTCSILAQNPQY